MVKELFSKTASTSKFPFPEIFTNYIETNKISTLLICEDDFPYQKT
jgi:hypothetical protein